MRKRVPVATARCAYHSAAYPTYPTFAQRGWCVRVASGQRSAEPADGAGVLVTITPSLCRTKRCWKRASHVVTCKHSR
jgi:hypothetical protein